MGSTVLLSKLRTSMGWQVTGEITEYDLEDKRVCCCYLFMENDTTMPHSLFLLVVLSCHNMKQWKIQLL